VDASNPVEVVIDGTGSLVSNVSTFTGDAKDFVDFKDFITDIAGRIRKRPGKTLKGTSAGAKITTLWEYTYTNPSTGATTNFRLRTFGTSIQYDNAGTWAAMTLPYSPTSSAWVFINANNRCFAVNGADDMIVFDGTGTTWRAVGQDGPSVPMIYALGGSVSFGVVAITQGSRTLTQSGAVISVLTSVGTTATATTASPHNLAVGDTVTISGAGVGAYNGSFAVTSINPALQQFTYTFGGGASPAGGAPIGYRNWVTGLAWVQKYVDINGVRYRINTVDSATQITLTEQVKEATASGLPYAIHIGVMDWDIGPRYAWAYYNPTTGHCSNIRSSSSSTATATQITESDQVGVTPTLTIGASAVNQAAYVAGYTQIKIFRTPKNGNVLVAIDTTVNNVNSAVTTITFTENSTTGVDTALTMLEAPLILNRKPPAGLVAIAYHQQRLWAFSRTGVYFSAAPSEVALGVAEECWPAKFYIAVNEPTGLLTVGGPGGSDNLIIQTRRGNYSVDGYDNRTFYAYRLPHRGTGSFQYNATAIEGALTAIYADKRVIEYPNGTDYGAPIQDKLTAMRASLLSGARMHWFANESRSLLFISGPKTGASSGNDVTYVFDRDLQKWYEWNVGFTAFATVHNDSTSALELWAGDGSGNVFQIVGSTFTDNGSNFQPTLTTSYIRPFGTEGSGRLQYLKAFVSDGANLPTGFVLIEEQSNTGATDGSAIPITFTLAPHHSQSAQGREVWFVPPASFRAFANTFQFILTLPSIAGDYYFDRLVAVFDPDQDTPAKA